MDTDEEFVDVIPKVIDNTASRKNESALGTLQVF
jgi:hypothetical protein